MNSTSHIRSDICWSDETSVSVLGQDLCHDLMGKLNFADFAFLLMTRRQPTPEEGRLFNAALVSLAEHGITPNVIATRSTYFGAPESLQSAIAAGLLGLGTRFVGTIEGSARLIAEMSATLGEDPTADQIEAEAEAVVARIRADGSTVPGIGHPIHRPVDPRAERLFELVGEGDFPTVQVAMMRAVSAAASDATGRSLPVNVSGAIGVCVNVLGIDWRISRGVGILARTAGLIGHVLEELGDPMAPELWHSTDEAATAHLRIGNHDG
jgi:citrate synthase